MEADATTDALATTGLTGAGAGALTVTGAGAGVTATVTAGLTGALLAAAGAFDSNCLNGLELAVTTPADAADLEAAVAAVGVAPAP